MLDFPPIPESQLENTDRQVTVDQMVERYDPERAVKITLVNLRWMNLDDLAEKLERYHTRDSSPVFSQALYPPSVVMEKPSRFPPSSVQHSLQILAVPALLLTSLEELTEEQLKTFQSYLTSGRMLGFPPIPESQLENTDRQDTVDQMVERYGPERAVKITRRILRGMKRVDQAEKLQRDHTRAVSTTETKWWRNSSDTGNDEEREKKHVHLSGLSRALDREAAGSKDTGITKDKYELVTKPTEKKREALLLATLEELSTDELKIFQQELTLSKQLPPYLTGFPSIPKTQLENNDRQVIVDQMLKRYGPEGVVEITLRILRRMNREDLAEKFERYHSRDSSPVFSQALYPPSVVMEKPSRFLPSSVQHSLQRSHILTVPALLLTSLEELTEEQLKTFQSNLTSVQLLGFPPIPESQLEVTDRQNIVDQMLKRYGPERVVEITLRILRRMNREDLAEKFERYHSRGKKRRTSEEPSWPGLVSRREKIEEHCVPLTGRAPFFIKHKVPDCPCPSHCCHGDQHVHNRTRGQVRLI
uniref:Pyrin domain-containing protein n=1 Tax=Oncorhynchus mykiss TaxID=8022 RepID=A0A8C7NH73_ONCMY